MQSLPANNYTCTFAYCTAIEFLPLEDDTNWLSISMAPMLPAHQATSRAQISWRWPIGTLELRLWVIFIRNRLSTNIRTFKFQFSIAHWSITSASYFLNSDPIIGSFLGHLIGRHTTKLFHWSADQHSIPSAKINFRYHIPHHLQ